MAGEAGEASEAVVKPGPINLLINIIQQDYYLTIFMTIITESDLLGFCMDNISKANHNYILGFIIPNPLGPPRPYPAPGIQEPKGDDPKPNPKPNFGDPSMRLAPYPGWLAKPPPGSGRSPPGRL